jgi:hypothetical protein
MIIRGRIQGVLSHLGHPLATPLMITLIFSPIFYAAFIKNFVISTEL